MENPVKTTNINIIDLYGDECLRDSPNKNSNIKRSPKGFVKIYDVDEKGNKTELVAKSNLVVYLGREWLCSRAFNLRNSSIDALQNHYLCWFGIGDGGTAESTPLTPISPTNNDLGLDYEVMINATDTSCGDYRVSPVEGYYKHPFDSVTFEQDENNSNAYIICKVTTTIGSDDANGYNLNEAGLFIGDTTSSIYTMYAKITFPTLVKSVGRILIFDWYIYM